MNDTQLPDKLFFKIGEVAQIVGVKPHVLRYWETELPALRPMKTRGAHRMYRRRDVELAMLVKRMLQDDGLTMAGTKRKLRELNRDRVASEPDPEAARNVSWKADLLAIRRELAELLKALDAAVRPAKPADAPKPMTATVTSAVPSNVPIRSRR